MSLPGFRTFLYFVNLPVCLGISHFSVFRTIIWFSVSFLEKLLVLQLIKNKMNVIAKSGNIAPFARATVTVVSNGALPASGNGMTEKKKIVVPSTIKRTNGYTLSQDIISAPIRVSSGPTGIN